MRKALTLTTLVACCALSSTAALSDPPAHAPAHGWRAKHVGHTGVAWEADFGIMSGTCDRRAVGTAIGGIVGGVIANRVADGDNQKIATLIGIAAGALVGNRIGRQFDKGDEACVGHALELGKTGQTVSWNNETTGVSYQLTPRGDTRRNGAACREFTLLSVAGSERSSSNGVACQSSQGAWEIIQ